MRDLKFSVIEDLYQGFYLELMKKGKLPMWSTEKGFWNASSSREIYELFRKLKLSNFKRFIDIGSGDGKVTLIASLFCKKAEGIEIDKSLHEKAIEIQARLGILNAIFHNKDFFEHNLSEYDVIFVAPDSPLERGLEKKLMKELNGKLVHFGHHFHPSNLKKEQSFLIDGTLATIYSK